MDLCPGCRAALGNDPVCRRCGCDLTLVIRTENLARYQVIAAIRSLLHGEREEAKQLLEQSLFLFNDPLTKEILRNVGILALDDFP